MNEREILYKILFDMKRDMRDMRQQIQDLMRNSTEPRTPIVDTPIHSYTDAEEAEEYTEDVSSIDEIAKEQTLRALEKSQGNRREAAKMLGMSERTLYRKIKEYGI